MPPDHPGGTTGTTPDTANQGATTMTTTKIETYRECNSTLPAWTAMTTKPDGMPVSGTMDAPVWSGKDAPPAIGSMVKIDDMPERGLSDRAESAPLYHDVCPKCRGTGRFVGYTGRYLGDCFHCKGKGKIERKTSPESRAHARQMADARKVRQQERAKAEAASAYPAEYAWLVAKADKLDFARSILDAVRAGRDLTDGQLAAIQRGIERDAQWAAERAAKNAAVNAVVDASKIETAFQTALSRGLKKPILRYEGLTLSLAPATGRNAGAIYIKAGGEYAGKIMGGSVQLTSEGRRIEGLAERLASVMANPVEAAVRYGRETGTCSCCGRTLTDPVSIAAGIGPICAGKFGW